MRKRTFFKILTICLLCTSTNFLNAQSTKEEQLPTPPLFKNGETIVFLGNSITRGGHYHTYIKLFYLTRFPEMNIKFVNAGVSGHTSPDGIKRLYQDVMIHQPDKIAMMFGMNDANTFVNKDDSKKEKEKALQKRIDFFKTNMDSITRLIDKEGVELIYIAPSIYDDKAKLDREIRFGGNRAIGMCRDVVYELAGKYQKPVVDFYTVMNEVNARYQKEAPTFTVVSGDRIHPQGAGHLLMGYQFLKTQNVPSVISDAAIDAAKMEVTKSVNCNVTQLSKTTDQYFFAIKSDALPFPIEDNKASEWMPMHEELNQERLMVNGLESGKYKLIIDGKEIAQFSAEALEKGINLADYHQTPQYQQAVMIRNMVFEQRRLDSDKLRALTIFDYGMLKDIPRTATMGAVRTALDEGLQKSKGKSYHSYLVAQSYKYMIYKQMTEETEEAIDRLSQSMDMLNDPLTHMYVLKRIEE